MRVANLGLRVSVLTALLCDPALSFSLSSLFSQTLAARKDVGATAIARSSTSTTTNTVLHLFQRGSSTKGTSSSSSVLTPLPKGLSPFEKSLSKSLDIQGTFRKLAAGALERALKDGRGLIELEFPPLAGGDQAKSQFDDFDNLSELDANRDWCVQWAPALASSSSNLINAIWLVLPDDKECELAKNEWTGQRYRRACQFTSIRAALTAVLDSSSDDDNSSNNNKVTKAWGSTFASAVNKLQGGDGILADSSTLDELDTSDASLPRLHLVCQPGNGGPVEDWINVETLHKASSSSSDGGGAATTCVVNGALDKVRDGYYPGLFFPALAATKPFYQDFEAAFFLKPISDKGLYGWLYRVYPEPWQVVLQTATPSPKQPEQLIVQDTVALVSETRPSYQQAVNAMVQTASSLQ